MPDTTGAVLLPQPVGCVRFEVNGSLLGISLLSVTPMVKKKADVYGSLEGPH